MRKVCKKIAIAAAIIVFMILIIVIYVNTYPYAVAESSDGNWKAAMISDKEFKYPCDCALMYKGNFTGNAENVYIRVLFDGKEELYWSEKDEAYTRNWMKTVRRKKSGGDMSEIVDNVLMPKKYFYWFDEGTWFDDADEIKIYIRWDEENNRRETSITLDVKTARDKYLKKKV